MKSRLLLGLSPTGFIEEQLIKETWRRLAGIHHPDKGGDSAEFDKLRKAYLEVLEESRQPRLCGVCNGSGKVIKISGWTSMPIACHACCGSGRFSG